MDRLFDRASHPEDQILLQLAEIELDLERHRRMRRLLLGGAAVASLLCWAYTRFGLAALVFAPSLFAFFALTAASLWFWERRLGSSRRRTLARLSAQTQRSLGIAR